MIVESLKLGLGYADRLLTDVTAEQFARFATPGGVTIEANHACFILGHLAIYPSKIVTQLGGELAVPDGFDAVFSKDAKCVDDPDGSIYPTMDVVVQAFRDGYGAASTAIESASPETLGQPNPQGGRMAEMFPTIGAMHEFYCGGHLMMHMGPVQYLATNDWFGAGVIGPSYGSLADPTAGSVSIETGIRYRRTRCHCIRQSEPQSTLGGKIPDQPMLR